MRVLELGHVGLRADDHPRPLEELGAVTTQLPKQHVALLRGRPGVGRRQVEQNQ